MRVIPFSLALILGLFSLATTSFAQDAAPSQEAQQLIDLLENDDAREALIASLKEAAAPAPSPIKEAEVSFGRQIAQTTSDLFESAATSLSSAVTGLMAVSSILSGLDGAQLAALWDAVIALAVVFVATTLSYILLRFYARKIYVRMGERAHDWDMLRTLAVLIGKTLIDVGVVLVAWGLGYFAALYLHGNPGSMGVQQSLYLNAFLLVGLARVVIRMILSPSTADLRFVTISDAASRRLSFWLGAIATVVGYGQLLIVPIVNQQASFSAGRGVSTLLAFVAIAMALTLVLRNRTAMADWLLAPDPDQKPSVIRFVYRNWYVPVLIYLVALAAIVAARPDGLIWPVLLSTMEVIGVIAAGILINGALSRSGSRGIRLPEIIHSQLPTLQERLNGLILKVLGILRVVVTLFVIGFALDAAGAFDFRGFLQSGFGRALITTAISVGLILLAGLMAWLALVSWVDYRLNPELGEPTSREKTLLTLLRNAVTIVLGVIVLMFALSEIGIDIAPLIASAGVLGLAIGFGAQKLVQDIITGIFIQFENAMNVGDVVTLGGTTGTVEKLTIRSITLRDLNGTVHLIPFSSVDMVSNYVKDFAYYVCDLGIAYRERVEDGRDAMLAAFELLKQGDNAQFIQGELEWFGVQALGDSAVVLRARIKCIPGYQWGVGRAYNELCKQIMDERGIEIPFPHQTIFFGENKDGTAPALRLRNEDPA